MNVTFSIVISTKEGRVAARNRDGAVIAEGAAGQDDARVFQKAVDSLAPGGGEIRIAQGRYRFSESILLDLPITITGEGQNTTIVPPTDDYAFKVLTTERSPLRPNCGTISGWQGDAVLTGVTIQMLTVDGERAGKGIYLDKIMDCLFQNLWMHEIHRGSALHVDLVGECNFVNIHLNGTGCKKTGAASIQLMGQHANNLRFNRVYTIFPEARGLEVAGGAIIYFNDCMWHGHFPFDTVAHERVRPMVWANNRAAYPNADLVTEELIYVKDVSRERGLTISRPRITNTNPDYCQVVVEKGTVSILDGLIGGGCGDAMIRAEAGARMRITGNYFYGFAGYCNDVLRCHGAEVVFRDNVIEGKDKRLALLPARRSVFSGNRFTNTAQGASLRALDDGKHGCEHVIISDNIFQESQAGAAIEISELSRAGVILRDNCFAGRYAGEPVRQAQRQGESALL